MKACSAAKLSVNGLTTAFVVKQKTNPKNIEIGRAGKALRQIASNRSVKQRPWIIPKIYTKMN